MKRALVIIDRQHAGKRSRPTDMGAQADVDGDGQLETWEREAELTPQYIAAIARAVEAGGHRAVVIDPAGAGLRADYSERHRQAVGMARQWSAGPAWYLAAHLNAGGNDYGLVGHDPRSSDGRRLAGHLSEALAACPVVSRVVTASLEGGWARGLPTVSGIYAGPAHLCGALLEPLFIDSTRHQRYIAAAGLDEVGTLIGEALVSLVETW